MASSLTYANYDRRQLFSQSEQQRSYAQHVNPIWVKLLDALGMNVQYTHCSGSELYTRDGRTILDCLSGYCVHNVGHNHPHVVAELVAELQSQSPAMLQSNVVEKAGALARILCENASGKVSKAFFCSSGSEGIEAVIKFARAHTGRTDLIYAAGAFHGLTCGALSLMGSDFWRESFGPMLDGTHEVPFGDLSAIEKLLVTKKIAAVILEPIQAEAGILLPPADYLPGVQKLCQKHGALFVLDEVQTGMGRTGTFLAGQRYGVAPDMIVMAKALSGGLVPCASVLMTEEIYKSVFHSLRRAFIHTSTFSENSLAMCAGIATVEVLQNEGLIERANSLGMEFRDQLRTALGPYEMVKEVRGEGMLTGIEFRAPRSLSMRISFEAFKAVHPGLFGQVLVMRMFNDKDILAQICGNNFMVLKVAPPLTVTESQLKYCVESIRSVIETVHSSSVFWVDALNLGRRAMSL
ncbi:aspartate aminotransferase family protein [Edaphobacter flagellatus]|uniref:aspartate aminotransferase family protein n=1 Tax=Edaphobacter flagellatus TaxID=1933044 RepID=UPI0021B301F2|nr:aspartate aminotransferase family protein [Edaphobacter flagellatus]